MKAATNCLRTLLCSAMLLATPLLAQDAPPSASGDDVIMIPAQLISPEAQAVLDRMTAYLRSLESFSIEARATRDEVVALGYKLQNNERATITVQRPNKLRAEIVGDIRDRTVVFDGETLSMYSPADAVYVRVEAPDTIAELIGGLLDAGVEMPLMDVLYQAAAGTLTEAVRGGIYVGTSDIEGVACDQLAFRQATIDWQIWVEQGARPVPRKIVITTRYEVGDPQYQATMHWNLKPKINKSTFVYTPANGVTEIPFDSAASFDDDAR